MSITEDDVRRIVREELYFLNDGGSIKDAVASLSGERVQSGVESFDGNESGGDDRPLFFDAAPEVVGVAAFESGVGVVDGGSQVVGDLAHGESVSEPCS